MTTGEQACIRLTQILFTVGEANKGSNIDDPRHASAESLAVKFGAHCISALDLSRGTKLAELRADFVDPASVNVIVRAAIEGALTFYYLFVAPKSDDEKRMRHDAWVLTDLMARQEFKPLSEEARRKLEDERQLIADLQTRLRANPAFGNLTKKQQRDMLEGQRWKLAGWGAIGLEMGLGPDCAETFYSYLCSHSHSGYLSVLQVQQARSIQDQRTLIEGSMGVLAIAIAHMIRLYAGQFPRCADALKLIPDAEPLIELWVATGVGLPDPTPAA